MVDKNSLKYLRQAKDELRVSIPKIVPTQFNGIGIGIREGTFAGKGGELESKLSPLYNQSDLCIRIYLRTQPPESIKLPSTYRGIYLGYVVSGEFKAL
jgi:hypothetical protein